MEKQLKRWGPDTCSCVIDFEVTDNGLVAYASVKECEAHAGLSVAVQFETLKTECALKNITMGQIQEAIKELTEEESTYAFDEDRNLVISLPDAAKSMAGELNEATPENVIVN